MSEDNDIKKKDLTVGGVSGSKKMRLGRVHKKKSDDAPEAAAPETEVKATAPAPAASAPAPAPAPAEEVKPVKKAAAKKVSEEKAEEKPAEEKKPAKKTAAKAEKTEKADKTEKTEKAEAPAKKAAPKKTSEKKPAEVKAEEKPAEEKKPAKKPAAKAVKAEEKPVEEKKPEEPQVKEPEVKEVKEEKPEVKPEPVKEEKPEAPKPAPKPRLSSAVISLPDVPARGETIRSSTVITYSGRDKKSPMRSGGQGGYNNNRQGGFQKQGGGFQKPAGGGFDKDKDDDNQRPQFKRAPKPRAEAPIEDAKKSRSSYAEKSAFDKKHNNNDRRDGEKNANIDKRKQSRTSQFSGRVNSDGDYDDFSFKKKKKKQESQQAVVEQVITEIKIPAFITVKEFAEGIGKKSSDIIMALMKLGVMATINQELDFDTACLVADSFGINAELLEEKTEEDILFVDEDNPENLETRPPVVVVMGHVDHGKTSLLDKIRSSNVTEGEAGGITQKIGAYTVRLKGRQITFLDTPGHEAFTTMRARGAQFTDIAILVVAADDGVMPQTIEAINHAKAANTEIIVAINKIDKPGANPDRVKQELTQYGLICEEWGGQTIMVPISAKQGTGIDDLLENVLLTADVMELKADPKGQAKGAVIEAKLDKNRGAVASVLIQRGTLRQGDTVVCGPILGNVRAMYDDKGMPIKKAGPSIPVEILGLPEVPQAGEILFAVDDDKTARQLVEKRKIKQREEQLHRSSKMSLDTLAAQMAAGDVKDLNIIIKADVQGSVEAVQQSLEKLTNEEVKINVIHGAVGAINESDIVLADVSNAIIIGFNVRPSQMIIDKAKETGVDIRLYSVIYNAIEDVENAMKGMLAPKIEEVVWGHAEVRQLFKVSGIGTIGGCYVTDGKIQRSSNVRVIRDDVVVYTGVLGSLQHEKDSVKEVLSGHECGLTVEKYNDIKIGDVIEAFGNVEVKRD